MAVTTLAEFLVKLGFQVQPAQQRQFEDALKSSGELVQKVGRGLGGLLDQFAFLATSAVGAAITLSGALTKIATDMAGLAFQAQRVGSSTQNIESLDYALQQMGLSAGHARGVLESVANLTHQFPQILERGFGVKPGSDTADALLQLGQRWRGFIAEQGEAGRARAVSEAQRLSIDQQAMQALVNPETSGFYAEAQRRRERSGLGGPDLGKMSIDIQRQLNELKDRFTVFSEFILKTWGPDLDEGLSRMNKWFEKHTPEINAYIKDMRDNFKQMVEASKAWYESLPQNTQNTLEKVGIFAAGALAITQLGRILGLVGRIMGLGPLAGPTGIIGSVALAVGVLANDYQTWLNTGGRDSLIDWSKWAPQIESAKTGLTNLTSTFEGLLRAAEAVIGFFAKHPALVGTAGGAALGYRYGGAYGAGIGAILGGIVGSATDPTGNAQKNLIAPLPAPGTDAAKELDENTKAIEKFLQETSRPRSGGDSGLFHKESYRLGGLVPDRQELEILVTAIVAIVTRVLGGKPADAQDNMPGSAPNLTAGNPLFMQAAFRQAMPSFAGIPLPGPEHAGAERYLSALESARNLPGGILDKVWSTESGRGQNMLSRMGAMGHFQFMPDTWKRYGQGSPFNFAQSAQAAAQYLGDLMQRFHGNVAQALAGYNWGEGNVEGAVKRFGENWRQHIPGETSKYLNRILGNDNPYQPAAYHRGGQGGMSINAPTNVTITGVSSPDRAAGLVDAKLDRRNADLIRRLKSAYV